MNGDLTPALIDTDVWTDDMVAAAGIPIVDVPFVTIGGGIGSFVTFDTLRIYGVPAAAMAASPKAPATSAVPANLVKRCEANIGLPC